MPTQSANRLPWLAMLVVVTTALGSARHSQATSLRATPHHDRAGLAVVKTLNNPEILAPNPIDFRIDEAGWPDGHTGEFLAAIAPSAFDAGLRYCVPPSVTMAQAALESGWGRSQLASRHHNLFGVKDFTHAAVVLPSTEVVDGTAERTASGFRVYTDWNQSIEDHGLILAFDPRYSASRTKRVSLLGALDGVWASDPSYTKLLRSIIRSYDLSRWDAAVLKQARRDGRCSGTHQ